MSPEASVAAAMIALVQPDTEGGKKRLEGIAQTIVAESRPVAFWPGDSGVAATGLMLVAIGYHESKFDEKVRRCQPRPGKYIGLYQILPGRNTRPHAVKDVCASDALQARKAEMLAAIVRHLAPFVDARELPRWSPLQLDVVLLGPSHEACRRWLAGAPIDPAWMRSTLPRVAWRSVAPPVRRRGGG